MQIRRNAVAVLDYNLAKISPASIGGGFRFIEQAAGIYPPLREVETPINVIFAPTEQIFSIKSCYKFRAGQRKCKKQQYAGEKQRAEVVAHFILAVDAPCY